MSVSRPKDLEQDLSIEEILASIRRIIAEDQEGVEARSAVQPPPAQAAALPQGNIAPVPARFEDSLRMESNAEHSVVRSAETAVERLQSQAPIPDTAVEEQLAVKTQGWSRPPASLQAREPEQPQPPQPQPLLAQQTNAAISSSFEKLTQQISVAKPVTMEELVTQMLRPLLKDWLDANLPKIVEQAVQKEIERVSRRGG